MIKPSVFEKTDNWHYVYRFDFEKEKVYVRPDEPAAQSEDGEPIAVEPIETIAYRYQEVEVEEPLTSNRLTQAVIAHCWPTDYEQKLINEFNMAQMGKLSNVEAYKATKAYSNFLDERTRLKKQVDDDFARWEEEQLNKQTQKDAYEPIFNNWDI